VGVKSILFGVAIVAAMLPALALAADDDPPIDPPPPSGELGGPSIKAWLVRAGVPDDVATLIAAVPQRETGGTYNPRVARGRVEGTPAWLDKVNLDANEARAAEIGHDRNRERFTASVPAERFRFGSGGLFGFLPSSALSGWASSGVPDMDPWAAVFDVPTSIAAALRYASAAWRWEAMRERPTPANLRLFWAAPGAMVGESPDAEAAARYDRELDRLSRDLVRAGLFSSDGPARRFADQRIARYDALPAPAILEALEATR